MAYSMRSPARTLAALIVAATASFTTCMAVAQISSGVPDLYLHSRPQLTPCFSRFDALA